MYKIYNLLAIFFVITSSHIMAQQALKGQVLSNGTGVPFASIAVDGTSMGTSANENGVFTLMIPLKKEVKISVTAIGYFKSTKLVDAQNNFPKNLLIELKESDLMLNQIVVTGSMKETYVKESPVKVEVLSSAFLAKIPANNIMEAINMVNGVQEQINCGVCVTKDIHINGMEGPYTLMLIDGMPIMSSLASVYGLSGIPTSLVDRIEIIKGPSSTLYGTEAVGGVINVITKSPENSPKLSVNSFVTTHGEVNLDAGITFKLKEDVFSTIGISSFYNQLKLDFNNDNFTDVPLSKRLSIFNKWEFKGKKNYPSSIAFRYYKENRFGGTLQWTPEDRGSSTVYGEVIDTDRLELIGSTSFPVLGEKLRFDYSYTLHKQDSYYGDMHYKADQTVLFGNLTWRKSKGNHNLLLGATIRNDVYEDNTFAESEQNNWTPGVFIEDEWKFNKASTLLSGIRFDYQENHGIIFSPRINFKQKISGYTTLRASFGTGFRKVHLFTEDHAALTGSRQVVIASELQPERSYNINLNLNHVFIFGESTGTIDFDAFYNHFTNKIIPDFESDPSLIIYDNLSGHGIAKGLAFNISQSFIIPLSFSVGGTFQEVYEVGEGSNVKTLQLFAPLLSGTYSVSYAFKKIGLSVDYLGKVMGPQHLPTYAPPFNRPETSPWFAIQNIQTTKKIGENFDIYFAVKNIFNWTQDSPLIAPEAPFGPNFDTAYAWGPLQTRRFLMGVKFLIQ